MFTNPTLVRGFLHGKQVWEASLAPDKLFTEIARKMTAGDINKVTIGADQKALTRAEVAALFTPRHGPKSGRVALQEAT